jgi:co-chaperonin GroES (HSP10)
MKEQEEFKVPDNFPKPFGQRVIVKEVQQEETTTKAGIILQGAKTLQDCGIGVLIAVGSAANPELIPGQYIAFDKRSNMAVYHKGVPYLHMLDYEIWMAFSPTDTRFQPKVADNEEKRRESNMDVTKRITEDANQKVDLLQNKDEMPKSKTIILPGK